ncbi:MAG: GNAT family N-acetyltransferase, partial [Spirochaetia bacterium]
SRNVCLFVKEDNKAAIRVYKKLGFQEQGSFQIRYFSHDSDK